MSALVTNLLLVMTFLAKRYGMLRSKANFKIVLQLLVSLVALISFASAAHFILFFFIALFYIHLMLRSSRHKHTFVVIAVIVPVVLQVTLLSVDPQNFKTDLELQNSCDSFSECYRSSDDLHLISNGINKVGNVINEIEHAYFRADIDLNDLHDRRVKIIKAMQAFSYSPIIGSGFDRPDDGPLSSLKIGYHNDWSYILVAGGLISICFLLMIVYKIWHVHPILALFFFIPGASHTLMFTMQIFCLYGIIWGIIYHSKQNRLRITSPT